MKSLLVSISITILVSGMVSPSIPAAETPSEEPAAHQLSAGKAFIYKLKPMAPGGRGYKLIYAVDAPLEVFWRFKTHFDNTFLSTNKRIVMHRFVSRRGNVVITEHEYVNKSKTIFQWQTTVIPDRHRLNFELLNPDECDQKYHYGYIQLEAMDRQTKVTQVAYFEFFGDFFWVNYPFYGGMADFLKYNVRWEQQTIQKLKDRYTGEKIK